MDLRVIKKFNGKAEGKTLCPGDVIQSSDVDRINALVGCGFCVIVALDSTPPVAIPTIPTPTDEEASATVEFQGKSYPFETVKAALGVIGVKVAHNAKEKAVSNALSTLTDEQAQTLAEALNGWDKPETDNE